MSEKTFPMYRLYVKGWMYDKELMPIVKVQVIKKTEKTVLAYTWGRKDRPTRESLESTYHKYFDTFKEAKEYALDLYMRKAQRLREEADEADKIISRVFNMREEQCRTRE